MLEYRANDRLFAVGDAIDVKLDGVGEELVYEDGPPLGNLHRLLHILPQAVFVIDYRHAAPAEDEARAHKDRIADLLRYRDCVRHGVRDSARRLENAHLLDERAEEVAVFRKGDVLGRRAEDLHSRLLKPLRQVERRLPAELNDSAVALLALVDLHHVLERKRLEIERIGRVVVGRDSLRVGVHHYDLVAERAQRKRRVAAAPVELYALPDAVWPAAKDHDFLGRIQVGVLSWSWRVECFIISRTRILSSSL